MPQVDITLAEGRSPSQIRDLLHGVHTTVLRTTNTRPEYIRVIVHEVPRAHWSTGDVTLAEMDAEHGTGPTTGRPMDSTTDGQLPVTEDQE